MKQAVKFHNSMTMFGNKRRRKVDEQLLEQLKFSIGRGSQMLYTRPDQQPYINVICNGPDMQFDMTSVYQLG